MINDAINRLEYLCDIIPQLLHEISEEEFSTKPSPEKWSKKEILGHLIDSATNNHQRFVRVQFEDCPSIWYDQDNWVAYSRHQQVPKEQLIAFWASYNRYLAILLSHIPNENLQCTCRMRDGGVVTLNFLIDDYVAHLEHHLGQMVVF
ncbi:DinB family protein [Parapedobacter tibetensis]|uniref:DinB family protein n=1 Tax=Parapedobacter tibetensis TaxID=2972951 RepID=UPI00214D756E|nr:DinB family protein [Parapedobacter tibetensis]